jgi:hypothetical protein
MHLDTDTRRAEAFTQQFEQLRGQLVTSMGILKILADVNRISPLAVQRGELERRDAMFSGRPGLAGDVCDEVAFPFLVVPRARTGAVFYGRDSTLASMDEFFASDASSTSLLSILLQGTGGVGKTQTALHFVHERIDRYDIVLWIGSETPLSLASSMTDIAKRLSFPGSESPGSDESNLSNFHKWMNKQALQSKRSHCTVRWSSVTDTQLTCTAERRCLLIYDNVETIDDNLKRYIPTTPGHMIITSQNCHAVYPGTKLIPLKPFSEKDGGCLLRELLQYPESQLQTKGDTDAAATLARMVEGLPLGILLLAGLINERGGESTFSFMKEFVEFPRATMIAAPRAIGYAKDDDRELDGEEHPLDRVWTMSFKSLTAPRLALMGIASFLSPDSIPRSIFAFGPQALKELPETLQHLAQVCGELPRHVYFRAPNERQFN